MCALKIDENDMQQGREEADDEYWEAVVSGPEHSNLLEAGRHFMN